MECGEARFTAFERGMVFPRGGTRPGQCERTYMKSTSESLSRPETSSGIAAEGNCVVVRRGGEQPEADLRSQTRVNPIRFATAASLLASGEACRTSGNRFLPHPSYTGEKRDVVDGWSENAGKVANGKSARPDRREAGRKPRSYLYQCEANEMTLCHWPRMVIDGYRCAATMRQTFLRGSRENHCDAYGNWHLAWREGGI